MNAEAETFDDIDKNIAGRLEELHQIERVPVGLRARVIRHYDRIRYANKTLGWTYQRIANDVLKPAGMLISATTLRIYMEEIAKRRDDKKARARRNRSPIKERGSKTITSGDVNATAEAEMLDEEGLREQSTDESEEDRQRSDEISQDANKDHAGVRRAHART